MIRKVEEPQTSNTAGMAVFCHHMYEYRKGLRNLILHTCRRECMEQIIEKLRRKDIAYLIYPVGTEKINVFFGDSSCIEVIRSIGKVNLSAYSDEEDFILGVMLGYDRLKQCARYLKRKNIRVQIGSSTGRRDDGLCTRYLPRPPWYERKRQT